MCWFQELRQQSPEDSLMVNDIELLIKGLQGAPFPLLVAVLFSHLVRIEHEKSLPVAEAWTSFCSLLITISGSVTAAQMGQDRWVGRALHLCMDRINKFCILNWG